MEITALILLSVGTVVFFLGASIGGFIKESGWPLLMQRLSITAIVVGFIMAGTITGQVFVLVPALIVIFVIVLNRHYGWLGDDSPV